MLSKPVQNAINNQINKEFYSAYLYLSMAAYFQATNLPGFAHWMTVQAKEEADHAMKFYNYINESNGKVVLEAIDKPSSDFKSPLDVMKKALEHEKKVTASINAIYELAVKEKDYPTQVMLQWFITEQVEEEKTTSDIIEMLKMIGDAPAGLIMADRQLGARAGK